MSTEMFPLRPAAEQISSHNSGVKALDPALALARLAAVKQHPRPTSSQGYGVIYHPEVFHSFSALAALEVWEKKSDWKIKNEISALRSTITNFNASQFSLDPRTAAALQSFPYDVKDEQRERLIILPIRVGRDNVSESEDVAGLHEFEFDLASTLWMVATHARLIEARGALTLCARGEQYAPSRNAPHSRIPVIEFTHCTVRLESRPVAECGAHLSIKGMISRLIS